MFGFNLGSLEMTTAPELLFKIMGIFILINRDVIKFEIQRSCFAHLLIAINSASVVDCATTDCFLVVHDIGPAQNVMT